MEEPIRWGCIGTGNIASAMAQQLSRMPDAKMEVLCSASGKPAASIEAERVKFGYARASTLDELVSDPNVDVVYVASANTAHFAHSLAALKGGKHVLCEKPLTMTVAEAEALFEEATARRLLLVDGTFQAYLPGWHALRACLPGLGALRKVELHKKIRLAIMNGSPLINKRNLGGGIFDGCGSYNFHAMCVIFGAAAVAALTPEDVTVTSSAGPPGVGDEVDWDTSVTVRIGGMQALLMHRAADDAWRRRWSIGPRKAPALPPTHLGRAGLASLRGASAARPPPTPRGA